MAADRPFDPDELARHRDFLCRLARGLLGDAARADDVVQQAFVLALERPPRDAGALATWLGRVVRRLSSNERRGRQRARDHEQQSARPAADDSQAEAAVQLEAQHLVLAAVRALEEPYRTAIWLRYYEDLAPGVIATRQGLPVKTVKTRLARGLERLRAELARGRGGDSWDWSAVLVALARRATCTGTLGSVGGALMAKKLLAMVVVLGLIWLGWMARPRPTTLAVREPVAGGGGELAAPTTNSERAAPEPQREPVPSSSVANAPLVVRDGASLDVHAVWEEDGSAAACIGFTLWPDEDSLAELHARSVETDADGRARINGLATGRYVLHGDRGTESQVELAAGEERSLEVVLPPGVDVLGRVVDGTGAPVGGAEVWLERLRSGSGTLAGRVVTQAAVDGSFRLRGLGRNQALGALAPGYAPAFLERLYFLAPAAGEREVRVTLVLDRPGHALAGRVLDRDGSPLEGARVAIGARSSAISVRPDGRQELWPRARLSWTDENGRFGARWVELDTVHVLAADHALARAEVRGIIGELLLRLEGGATIEGTVRASDGTPVPAARVAVYRAGALDLAASPFELPSTRTGADGAYRLEHVPSGEVELVAGFDGLGAGPRIGVRTTRACADGEYARWDLELVAARAITGWVVDTAGIRLGGRTILVGNESATKKLASDAEGAFAFTPNDPEGEWTFTLPGAGGILDQREHVHVGDEVELVARVHEGRIRGGFSDRAVLVREGERVRAVRAAARDEPMIIETDVDATGAFAFEEVAPGRYRVTILSGERELVSSPWFDLGEDATVDLAWLETEPPR